MNRGALDELETERLSLERLRPDHAADLIQLLTDPRVSRTTWPQPSPPTGADIVSMLEAMIAHWERYGFGYWLLRDRETGATVGRGGLQRTHIEGLEETEAGWAIGPARWGEGLATELAGACVAAAFGELGLEQIIAFALPDNLASRRVMEKVGFRYEREIVHAALPHVLYRRHADPAPAADAPRLAPSPLLRSARRPL